MKCPKCQTVNAANAVFCQSCGFNFTQTAASPNQTADAPRKNKLSTPLIIIGIVVGICGLCGILGAIGAIFKKNQPMETTAQNSNSVNVSPTTTKPAIAAKATPEPEKDSSGVTIENFNKLKTGMTYDQVVKILGSEGTVLSESEVSGYKTVMYQWKGGYVANMNAMFQNGKMISKAQLGLD